MQQEQFSPERDKPLAPLASFGIGGTAEYFATVGDADGLSCAYRWAAERGIPVRVIGSATNVVFPARLTGLLVRMRGGTVRETGKRTLAADAGVPLQTLVDAANARGYEGLQTLAGIPGTVGGAVVGNAGAYGKEVSDCLESVTVFAPEEDVKHRVFNKKECGFSYRESRFKREPLTVLGATFRFGKGNPRELGKTSEDIQRERVKKYPPGLRCPGSFFKNIPMRTVSKEIVKKLDQSRCKGGKIPAGYLVEAVGAKGRRAGGVRVADWHGNLIINEGFGTADDVRKLAAELRESVRDAFGITLEEEVRYF